ncbi:MAG: UDP-N-acetylmuramoyl-tripeptide--D-alanyl-D-alanine ligase [Desulfomonilaceae bacterium]
MRSEAGPYKVKDILKATCGQLAQGGIDDVFEGICTDSRELKKNDLFVPLKGQNFDGNNFVLPALEAGAGGSLVNRDVHLNVPLNLSNSVLIKVQDTLQSLTDLASTHRKIYPVPLIAITGSAGKTTVKEMIGAILKRLGPVKITAGNFNNLIGLPMTVLDIGKKHKYAVIEAGVNQPGEMESLARAAAPDISVITNVGQAHLEGLGSLENVATEKFKLVEHVSDKGLGIVPAGNVVINSLLKSFHGRHVSFGLQEGDYRAANIRLGDPTTFEMLGPFGRTRIQWSIYGIHNITNALAAFAATSELGVEIDEIVHGLQNFRPPAWRMEIVELKGSRKLFRDFYNANPLSMKAALETLVASGRDSSTVAILGDMMELGAHGPELHREIGAFAGKIGVDAVIFVGKFREHFASGFLNTCNGNQLLNLFDNKEQAWEFMKQRLGEYSRILVKGSRSMKMEMIADKIEKEL